MQIPNEDEYWLIAERRHKALMKDASRLYWECAARVYNQLIDNATLMSKPLGTDTKKN